MSTSASFDSCDDLLVEQFVEQLESSVIGSVEQFLSGIDSPISFATRIGLIQAEIQHFASTAKLQDYLRRFPEAQHDIEEFFLSMPDVHPGDRVGEYELIRPIGAGGMGSVWVAQQLDPKRLVAIKFIQAGAASRELLRRFSLERNVQARFSHRNIASIYSSGYTPSGRPFFAMEYIDGDPIDTYCNVLGLPIRERLRLFLELTAGVQHAHQSLIAHRDIKPSNVLVTKLSSDPELDPHSSSKGHVKIIDFGLAKEYEDTFDPESLSVFTRVGTPCFMSPEQANLGSQNVDVRTDIYSMGVVLYLLLVDSLPFPRERFAKMSVVQRAEMLLCEEVPSPSMRLMRSGASSDSIASNRRITSRELAHMLKGDLDAIVMKSLEKDPNRRYQSAAELSEDIVNYLECRPIKARPATSWYRLSKLVRRNPISSSLVAMLCVALLVGLTAFLIRSNQLNTVNLSLTEAQSKMNRLGSDIDIAEKTLKNTQESLTQAKFTNDIVELAKSLQSVNTFQAQGLGNEAQLELDAASNLRSGEFQDLFATRWLKGLVSAETQWNRRTIKRVAETILDIAAVDTPSGPQVLVAKMDPRMRLLVESIPLMSPNESTEWQVTAPDGESPQFVPAGILGYGLDEHIDISADGRWLAMSDTANNSFFVWSLERKKLESKVNPKNPPSPEDRYLVRFSHEGKALVLGISNSKQMKLQTCKLSDQGVQVVGAPAISGISTGRLPPITEDARIIAPGIDSLQSGMFSEQTDDKAMPWRTTSAVVPNHLSRFYYHPAADSILSVPIEPGLGIIGQLRTASDRGFSVTSKPSSVSTSRFGNVAAIAMESRSILLLNTTQNPLLKGIPIQQLVGAGSSVVSMSFASNDELLIAGHANGEISEWSLFKNQGGSPLRSGIITTKACALSGDSSHCWASIARPDGAGNHSGAIVSGLTKNGTMALKPTYSLAGHYLVGPTASILAAAGQDLNNSETILERIDIDEGKNAISKWTRSFAFDNCRVEQSVNKSHFLLWKMPQSLTMSSVAYSQEKIPVSDILHSISPANGDTRWTYRSFEGEIVHAWPLNRGGAVLTTIAEGRIQLLDAAGSPAKTLKIPLGKVLGLGVLENPERVVCVIKEPEGDGTKCLAIRLEDEMQVGSWDLGPIAIGCEFRSSPNSDRFLIGSIFEPVLFIMDTSTMQPRRLRLAQSYASSQFASNDEIIFGTAKFSLTGGFDESNLYRLPLMDEKAKAVRIKNVKGLIPTIGCFEDGFDYVDSKNGQWISSTQSGEKVLYTWNRAVLEECTNHPRKSTQTQTLAQDDFGPTPICLAVSPDDRWITGIGRDGTLSLLEANAGRLRLMTELSSLRKPEEEASAPAFAGLSLEWLDAEHLVSWDILSWQTAAPGSARGEIRGTVWTLQLAPEPKLVRDSEYRIPNVHLGFAGPVSDDLNLNPARISFDSKLGQIWLARHRDGSDFIAGFDARTGREIAELDLIKWLGEPEAIVFGRQVENRRLAVAAVTRTQQNQRFREIHVCNLDTSSFSRLHLSPVTNEDATKVKSGLTAIALTHTGTELAALQGKFVQLFHVESSTKLMEIESNYSEPASSISFARDDSVLLVHQFGGVMLFRAVPSKKSLIGTP